MNLLAATTVTVDWGELSLRLLIDAIVALLVVWGLYFRRHERRDLVVVFVAFNIGLFAVVSVISTRHISTGFAFGLFAILSLIRLRSEPFDNVELGYFFSVLVLALVNGVAQSSLPLALVLDALIAVVVYLVDHPSIHAKLGTRRVTLDRVETDEAKLRVELAERFGVDIVELAVTDVDDVRETTDVRIRYVVR